MIKKILNVDYIDLNNIGRVYHLDVAAKRGDGWESTVSAEAILSGECKIGLVRSEKLPVSVASMERHFTTEEAMIATNEAIVVAVAPDTSSGAEDVPHIEDVLCILLKAGDVFVINKGVWHSACYGLNESALYYFLYEDYDEEIIWTKIKEEPCEIVNQE